MGHILRQVIKIYASPPDKDTNGKAFHLYSKFSNGCSSMENILSTDCLAYQQRI